jgi:hypothetical protein
MRERRIEMAHPLSTHLDRELLMRRFLVFAVVLAGLSGCAPISEKNAGSTWLSSPEGHAAMMKMIHRRPKNGNFGAIGS